MIISRINLWKQFWMTKKDDENIAKVLLLTTKLKEKDKKIERMKKLLIKHLKINIKKS